METKSRPKYLVALCGLHRTGKDTLATALASTHGFFRVAFSDSLYEEVAESFGVRVSELHSDLWKQNPQNLLSIQCSDSPKYRAMMQFLGHDLSKPRTSRFLLQTWAHEYRRALQSDYWITEAAHRMRGTEKDIVVSDLRYQKDEYPFLLRFAAATGRVFRVIQVIRPAMQTRESHPSEDGLEAGSIDHSIVNEEDRLFETIEKVEDLLNLA